MARQDPIGFARLIQFMLEHVRRKFSGTLTIQFLDGGIITVRREETWIHNGKIPVTDETAVTMIEHGDSLARLASSSS